MLPLYATRIEDLGQGDFVKVDCAACHHVALLTPQSLLRASESDEYYQSSQFPSWTREESRLRVPTSSQTVILSVFRFAHDSLLEGDGFEPSVSGAKEPVSGGKVTYG
jgi:hypothetical protein